ncbi:hypothetical protein BU24DRAFT_464464 [Aaosphaeria arxii CBS 175.79]|uniref:Uncharacterized protein n=1 Tax=Aaosphaeria arxii CBS 175.79 TaxID=1450172 RepID=A0A6A5XLU8_9PLEO|nr:uncharacterized protein BU24DRAFT_464464 [Aaosphaeria arxii CBS 175.79]KAF2013710.1 hypothetical protein BU24DRAFT_464464 [Aaosphaeria arxii CBS 175.79]
MHIFFALPHPLLTLLFLTLPSSHAAASPQPALVSEEYVHLIPRNTLFFRQLANLNSFGGNLGSVAPLPITNSGDAERPFAVDGDTFPDFKTAAQRSCDKQANECSQAANEGDNKQFAVSDCDKQKEECRNTLENATVQDFTQGVASENIGKDPEFEDFDLICEV